MDPTVTVAVPSFNQGRYLDQALRSIFAQGVPVEVFVADGGSTDESVAVIRRWESRLSGWRSNPDAGQSAAVNESIARARKRTRRAEVIHLDGETRADIEAAEGHMNEATPEEPERAALQAEARRLLEAKSTSCPTLSARFSSCVRWKK